MPLATLHLISLNPQTSLLKFLTALQSTNLKPITLAKVIRWIITPESIDTSQLLSPIRPYDLLLILPGANTPLPGPLESTTSATYTLQVGIPSRLLSDYASTNASLLHPPPGSVPALTGSLDDNPIVDPHSSQTLTLSPSLQSWIADFAKTPAGQGAVSMLNLLAFIPEKRESYMHYGKAFAETIGSKRGGNAKLVGHVVYPDSKPEAHQQQQQQQQQQDILQTPAVSLGEKSSNDNDSKKTGTANLLQHEILQTPAVSLDSPSSSSTQLSNNNAQQETLQVPAVSLDSSSPSASPSSSSSNDNSPDSTLQVPNTTLSSHPSPSPPPSKPTPPPKWDEFALAHYPSITHFADMLGSRDYQAVNQEFRVPALRDTCILCTSEIAVEEVLRASEGSVVKAKL